MARNINDDLNRFYHQDDWQRDVYGAGSSTPRTSKALTVTQDIDLFPHGMSKEATVYAKPTFVKCASTHPALKLPGTSLVIYGGACSAPIVHDADIYIGFDRNMNTTEISYPWKKGVEFIFPIADMGVPSKPEEFKKLVTWSKIQLDEGKKLHCGCIGGHGRTGMFLAAMVAAYGEKDAISYVRQHYCEKAVESNAQVNFLHEHCGINKIDVHGYKSTKKTLFDDDWRTPVKTKTKGKSKAGGKLKANVMPPDFDKVTPLHGISIWDAP